MTHAGHGFSPDAFVQAAFQAAYFSLYGRMESTYEPAMVKAFLHGRTEAIRTVTPEMAAFVQAFCSDATPRRKIDALRKAVKGHTELTKKCSAGLGQVRGRVTWLELTDAGSYPLCNVLHVPAGRQTGEEGR